MDATFGYKVRNQRHREESNLSEVIASRDLKRLTQLGLLEAVGEKRGRYYLAGEPLKAIAERCADRAKAANPYDVIGARAIARQLALPV